MNVAKRGGFFKASPTHEHVTFMLKEAEQLVRGRTLHDLLMRYSKANDLVWHLDFAEYKAVLVIARNLVRQGDDRIGKPAGKFNHLLGKQVYPSSKDANAAWRAGIKGKTSRESEVTGLANPQITQLVELAKVAGDIEFSASETVKIWARMPKRERAVTLEKQTRSYIKNIEDASLLEEKQHKLDDAIGRIETLEKEVQQLLAAPSNLDQLAEQVMLRMSERKLAPAQEAEAVAG